MSLKMMKSLLLCFMLLDLIYGQRDTFGYFVTLPAILRYSSIDTLCVHMRSTDTERELTVSMATEAANKTLLTWKHIGEGRLHCSTFQVPAATGEAQEVATILESITANGVQQTMERKYVLLKESELGIFIQTDKPIYQPLQTVNCRIVRINKDLIARNKAFDLIELQDSENNTIVQWKNMQPQNGIVDLSHDLPRELSPGNYTFTVRGKKDTSSTFLVNEYALPRFALVVNTPHSVPITQEYLDFTTCATYSHGKTVQGAVNGTICHSGTNGPCKTLKGKMDASGCCTMRTDTESLRIKSSRFRISLIIDVELSFTEDGTGPYSIKMEPENQRN